MKPRETLQIEPITLWRKLYLRALCEWHLTDREVKHPLEAFRVAINIAGTLYLSCTGYYDRIQQSSHETCRHAVQTTIAICMEW